MKTHKFTITLESNLTGSQEDDLFVDLKDTINKFEEYHCIDINNLNITSNSSDISEMIREPLQIKDNDKDKEIHTKGFIQTEIIPLFKCSNCKEEVENECGFELNEELICRKCYSELEEDESNDSLENKCEWCGADWNSGETCNELIHYINR